MKITKKQLKQIIQEELNEVVPVGTPWAARSAAHGLGQPRWKPGDPEISEDEPSPFGPEIEDDPDPTSVLQKLLKKWTHPQTPEAQVYKDELEMALQKIKEIPIRENQSQFQKVTRKELRQMLSEGQSDIISNLYKWCPAGTQCLPESTKTKWWKGR